MGCKLKKGKMTMKNGFASALALAALDSVEFGPLSEADRALLIRFNPELADDEFLGSYEYTVADYDGRRFYVGDDGDCYIVENDTIYYIPVEGSGPDESETEIFSAKI